MNKQNSMSKPKIDYYLLEAQFINYNDFTDKYPKNYCWQSSIVLITLFYISFIEKKNALQRSSVCIYINLYIDLSMCDVCADYWIHGKWDW